jgi:hypothetical protein
MSWKRPTSPVAKKFRSQPSAPKIMLTLFWDMEGAILVHFIPKDETVNSQNYCGVLTKDTEAHDQIQTAWKISKRRHLDE